MTQNTYALARSGVILTRHYTHWHCSPTRRSFLSGRLPIHHGEQLSNVATDDIDLRWTLVSQKLKSAGYRTHWVGKGHTGYASWNHLPLQRGFDSFVGYLTGAQSYTASDRWQDNHPLKNDTRACACSEGDHTLTQAKENLSHKHSHTHTHTHTHARTHTHTHTLSLSSHTHSHTHTHTPEYSSILYGETALSIVGAHDVSQPLFLYLAWQAVHEPYDPVPGWNARSPCFGYDNYPNGQFKSDSVYCGMLADADVYIGRLVDLLTQRGMYENTIIVYSTDNGGIDRGVK
jgi:arylsulfatase A-like enzyme